MTNNEKKQFKKALKYGVGTMVFYTIFLILLINIIDMYPKSIVVLGPILIILLFYLKK